MRKISLTASVFIFLLVGLSCFAFAKEATPPAKSKEFERKLSEQYQNEKKNYLEAVENYKTVRQEFLEAKEKLRNLKTLKNEELAVEKAKKHLLKSLEIIIRHLEILKGRIQNIPDIDPTLVASLTSEIDGFISEMSAKKATVESATTLEELRPIFAELKDYWRQVQGRGKRITGYILAARFNHFMNKLETLSQKLIDLMAELSAKGVDTSEVETHLAKFDENLVKAEEKYNLAIEKFNSITTLEEANSFFVEGHNLLKEAHTYLKQAHAALREATRIIRELSVLGEGD